MPEIDSVGALVLLSQAVEDRGSDYVYPEAERTPSTYGYDQGSCKNVFSDGTAGCIVGHVLIEGLGVPAQLLVDVEANDAGVNTTLHRLGNSDEYLDRSITFTNGARHLLATAQAAQDSGDTWGNSLAVAVSELRSALAMDQAQKEAQARLVSYPPDAQMAP